MIFDFYFECCKCLVDFGWRSSDRKNKFAAGRFQKAEGEPKDFNIIDE